MEPAPTPATTRGLERWAALGALADAVDLRTALYVCAAAPVAAILLALPLPSSRPGRRLQVEPVVP